MSVNANLRSLPSVDDVLRSELGSEIAATAGPAFATQLIRAAIDYVRGLVADREAGSKADMLAAVEVRVRVLYQADHTSGIRRVINATGVIIHTNLGRAPLSTNAVAAITTAAGACTLEYDIATGGRGGRGQRAEDLVIVLTGAEAALIVNNCAAAAYLMLNALARGGEVVISRGEMVEIGGDFRIPDILAASGGVLREVGTTNRTRLADYEKAINENTRMILRVHPSNYRIVGFTATPTLDELAELAARKGVILFEDIGSGALVKLKEVGLADEPIVADSITAGVDVVTFSGDKLVGGPQSGIIVGRRETIDILRRHPLYRALRVDKLTYAAVEATLLSFRAARHFTDVPVLRNLAVTAEQVGERAAKLVERLTNELGPQTEFRFEIIDGHSTVGGGAAPSVEPATRLLAISHPSLSASRVEKKLRSGNLPVVARVSDARVVLDLRTVAPGEAEELLAALIAALTPDA